MVEKQDVKKKLKERACLYVCKGKVANVICKTKVTILMNPKPSASK